MLHQRTIENSVSCCGVGVHSGKIVNLKLFFAEINTGIKFIRKDIQNNNEIVATYPNVISKGFSTTLINQEGVSVDTVEHLMAALWFLNITNLIVEIDGEEMPIMDGSSEYFIFLLEAAGILLQEAPMKTLDILRDVVCHDDDKVITATPGKGLGIDFHYNSDSKHSLLPNGNFIFNSLKMNFKYDIAKARTFSTIEQVEYLKKQGLATGGNLLNALVINNDKIANKEQLRYDNEPIRHKILDCIGDLYLSGYHINGHFECRKSGHQMNVKMLEKIFSDKENYKISIQE